MKKASKHSFSINSNVDSNSYNSDQKSDVTMSDEHFTTKQIAKVQMIFMQASAEHGWRFENSVTQVDIPGDEEESWKKKAEESKAESSKRFSELQDEKKKAKALQIIIDAGKAQQAEGISYNAAIKAELDKITYDYERNAIRKILEDMNALTTD